MNTLIEYNDKLLGAPAGILVCFACIVVGYILKVIKVFPNRAIPLVVVLFAAAAFMLIAPSKEPGMLTRIWIGRNLLIGLCIGFAAWMSHKLVLKRIEKKLGIFDKSMETEFVEKPDKPKDT